MKTMLLIYNPHSGSGKARRKLPDILDALTEKGWLVTVYPTTGTGDATVIAGELGASYDRVVCCGGDGTLNETVSGLVTLRHLPPLGYIPTGTTNDFSRNLALPGAMSKAASVAAAGHPRFCDVGQFNDRAFVYIAAFGAFTDVSYDTPQSMKSLFGHLAYLLEGASRLTSLKPYYLHLEHDGQETEGEFLYGMVSNSVSVGGFRMPAAGRLQLDDGLFEGVFIRAPKTPAELQGIVRGLLTQDTDASRGAILSFQTAKLTVRCDKPLPWTLDGEYGGDPTVAHIENRQKAIQIICGKP